MMDKRSCEGCGKEFYPRNKEQKSHVDCVVDTSLLKVLVIPDTQTKPGVNTDHLEHIGKYIENKRPDVVVHLGDHWDMPSLSSYDVGKRQFEGRRVKADLDAGRRAFEKLVEPFAKVSGYNPRKVFLTGNHEYRLQRLVDSDARLEGIFSMDDFNVGDYGFESHPFLTVVEIGGAEFSHYFTSGVMGRPVSSAAVLLRERQQSAIQGHVQRFDMAVHPKTSQIAIFVGLAYTHQEEYLTPQGNGCRPQIMVMHELREGIFDPMIVSLDFLKRRYGR